MASHTYEGEEDLVRNSPRWSKAIIQATQNINNVP